MDSRVALMIDSTAIDLRLLEEERSELAAWVAVGWHQTERQMRWLLAIGESERCLLVLVWWSAQNSKYGKFFFGVEQF